MEPPFDALPGVLSTTSGYIGGTEANPTYEQLSAGGTGHAEAVQVRFDPARISYQQLLDVFWRNTDPVTPNRQFCDASSRYRSAIFYHDAAQQELAERSKASLEQSNRFSSPIVTQIAAATGASVSFRVERKTPRPSSGGSFWDPGSDLLSPGLRPNCHRRSALSLPNRRYRCNLAFALRCLASRPSIASGRAKARGVSIKSKSQASSALSR